jgi:hypothetical protein
MRIACIGDKESPTQKLAGVSYFAREWASWTDLKFRTSKATRVTTLLVHSRTSRVSLVQTVLVSTALRSFSCAAGKSNLMDAISFVVGLKASNMRETQLKDLCYRGSSTSAAGKPTFVTLVYDDDGEETHFTRTIHPGTGGNDGRVEYKRDGRVLSAESYHKHLRELGINVKAQNFLVFQVGSFVYRLS